MESDLEMVIKNRATVLSPADVKAYMRMLLQALQACHGHWIAHRDVKPNNFLIAASGKSGPGVQSKVFCSLQCISVFAESYSTSGKHKSSMLEYAYSKASGTLIDICAAYGRANETSRFRACSSVW